MMSVPRIATVGKLVLFFGAQSFMNIFMGWVFHINVIVPQGVVINGKELPEPVHGAPVGVALTAMQQVISLLCFIVLFGLLYYTPYKITPKTINSRSEVFSICIFGCVFALNIALNNFSLGYISIAVNLIIRSCLPLTTFLSQQGLSLVELYPRKPCKALEMALMVAGVFCAGLFTYAKIMGSGGAANKDASNMVLGVVMCIASLLCGSLNLALAGVLGETKLNVYDTVAYMALPATVFLAPIALFLPKQVPGEWYKVFGKHHLTDFEVLKGTWEHNKTTMMWLLLSGVFSFIYNIIQFTIVHTLSPSATAFGGNFNKAALVFLTLLLPFLRVNDNPPSPWIQLIWLAVICNIAAFSYYSYLQILAKRQKEEEEKRKAGKLRDESSEEDDDGSSSSSSDGKGMC